MGDLSYRALGSQPFSLPRNVNQSRLLVPGWPGAVKEAVTGHVVTGGLASQMPCGPSSKPVSHTRPYNIFILSLFFFLVANLGGFFFIHMLARGQNSCAILYRNVECLVCVSFKYFGVIYFIIK